MEVNRIALYQDTEDRLYIVPEGKNVVWGEWLCGNNQLFRADGWAIGCGEEYSEATQATIPHDAQLVASYFPEDDQVQIHSELKAHALDYIFGAKGIAGLTACWLCGRRGGPFITITTQRETPGGTKCRAKKVPVHNGCYMDMEP